MIIAVDFDGTIVQHDYPQVGAPVPLALDWLRQFLEHDVQLILWTMRSDLELNDAIEYMANNSIPLWGINTNPQQREWTNSPKAYAHLYIDDAAANCPLVRPKGKRPYVDWRVLGPIVLDLLEDW